MDVATEGALAERTQPSRRSADSGADRTALRTCLRIRESTRRDAAGVGLLITEVLEAVISARLPGLGNARHLDDQVPGTVVRRRPRRARDADIFPSRRAWRDVVDRKRRAGVRVPVLADRKRTVASPWSPVSIRPGGMQTAVVRVLLRARSSGRFSRRPMGRAVWLTSVGSSFESALTRARPSEPSSSAGAKESLHETRSAPHFGLDRERPLSRDDFLNHQQAQASSFRAFVETSPEHRDCLRSFHAIVST